MENFYFNPRITNDTKAFWEGCAQNKIVLQKCECGHIRYPAAIVCPKCLSTEFKYEQVEPKGKLYSFVKFVRPFHKSLEEKIPYCVAVIELDCNVTILGNLLTDNKEPVCGSNVEIAWQEGAIQPIFKIKE